MLKQSHKPNQKKKKKNYDQLQIYMDANLEFKAIWRGASMFLH